MHRAYQPLLPATNKYLKEKWDGDDLRRHRRKVAMATPVVDTKGFVTPGHLQVNLKKIQRKKERQAVTDRDNLLLSTRLAEIGNSKGRVDNWNNYAERSLNSEKRRRDMSKITLDNGKILERIEKRESEYRREKWEQHWERVEHIRDDIARYPRGTWLRREGKKKVKFLNGRRKETSSEFSSLGNEDSSDPYENGFQSYGTTASTRLTKCHGTCSGGSVKGNAISSGELATRGSISSEKSGTHSSSGFARSDVLSAQTSTRRNSGANSLRTDMSETTLSKERVIDLTPEKKKVYGFKKTYRNSGNNLVPLSKEVEPHTHHIIRELETGFSARESDRSTVLSYTGSRRSTSLSQRGSEIITGLSIRASEGYTRMSSRNSAGSTMLSSRESERSTRLSLGTGDESRGPASRCSERSDDCSGRGSYQSPTHTIGRSLKSSYFSVLDSEGSSHCSFRETGEDHSSTCVVERHSPSTREAEECPAPSDRDTSKSPKPKETMECLLTSHKEIDSIMENIKTEMTSLAIEEAHLHHSPKETQGRLSLKDTNLEPFPGEASRSATSLVTKWSISQRDTESPAPSKTTEGISQRVGEMSCTIQEIKGTPLSRQTEEPHSPIGNDGTSPLGEPRDSPLLRQTVKRHRARVVKNSPMTGLNLESHLPKETRLNPSNMKTGLRPSPRETVEIPGATTESPVFKETVISLSPRNATENPTSKEIGERRSPRETEMSSSPKETGPSLSPRDTRMNPSPTGNAMSYSPREIGLRTSPRDTGMSPVPRETAMSPSPRVTGLSPSPRENAEGTWETTESPVLRETVKSLSPRNTTENPTLMEAGVSSSSREAAMSPLPGKNQVRPVSITAVQSPLLMETLERGSPRETETTPSLKQTEVSPVPRETSVSLSRRETVVSHSETVISPLHRENQISSVPMVTAGSTLLRETVQSPKETTVESPMLMESVANLSPKDTAEDSASKETGVSPSPRETALSPLPKETATTPSPMQTLLSSDSLNQEDCDEPVDSGHSI